MEFENLPEGWKTAKIKDILESTDYVANGSFQALKENVSYKDVPDYAILIRLVDYNSNWSNSFVYVDKHAYDFLKKSYVNPKDIIISNVGANVGTVFQAPDLGLPMTLGPNSVLLRIKSADINRDYIFYYLKSYYGQGQLQSIVSGSAQPKFNKTDLRSLELPFPPFPQQQKIASILGALDDKIELNNQMNQTLETMAKALFKSWFVDFEPFADGEFEESEFGMIPKGWKVGIVGEIIEFINGYAFKSKDLLEDFQPDTYRVFKMGHIKRGGGFDGSKTKSYIEKSQCTKLDKYILKVGDLLMAMTDMKANVAILGHTALMIENDRYVVNQRVGLIRPKNSIGIDYPFLYLLTNSSTFIEDLRSRANSGVQVNLSTSEIKDTTVIIPTQEVNLAFDKAVKPLFLKIAQNQQEIEILSSIRDSLLPKLMSGEIEI